MFSLLVPSNPLLAWGAEGHRAIAALAQELISSTTQTKVQQLLDECGYRDLASASTWADEVRENAHSDKPRPKDAEDFNRQFPNNASWHFVDLPLGTGSLAEAERLFRGKMTSFTPSNVASWFWRARRTVPGESSRTQALRLLVHFVGDIHQPLHCGTGFYRISDTEPPVLVTNPQEAFGLPNDRGGNDLFYGPKEELHALWDIGLVAEIADTFDFRSLEAILRQIIPQSLMARHAGRLSSLGRNLGPGVGDRWRNQPMPGSDSTLLKPWANPNRLWISITLPSDYEAKNRALAAQQLSKAAVRLAQLLDRIQWP